MRFGAMCNLHRCNFNSIAILQIVIKALSFTIVEPNLLSVYYFLGAFVRQWHTVRLSNKDRYKHIISENLCQHAVSFR